MPRLLCFTRTRWSCWCRRLAAVGADADRAARAIKSFAEHDAVVLTKLYAVHQSDPDAHLSVSNELRDQFALTLREDEAVIAAKSGDVGEKSAQS